MIVDCHLSCMLLLFVVGLPCAKCFPVDLAEEAEVEQDIADISRLAEHIESGEIVSRDRRGLPRMAKIMRATYNVSDLDVIYTEMRRQKIRFPIGDRVFSNSIITLALLKVYKKPPSARHWKRLVERHNIHHGRVSVHQVVSWKNNQAKIIDSRLVSVEETGWMTFHVTSAIKEWTSNPSINKGFELRTESIRPGEPAARIARQIRFIPQSKRDDKENRPILIICFKPKT
ncbi:left-right determination factor 2-like [Lineus longissimus]|uniref:left-right determination factor 2-like n=1 Tax=Lineus longissimus TaxID=88925 RepID=UPI00315CF9BD